MADQALGSQYVLHELLGRGSMGQVFRGSVRESGAPVAVKVLRPELVSDPEIVGRFVQERAILVSVSHPNVVRVIDLVVEGETLGIVMELVRGQDLRRHLRERRTLPPTEAARYGTELLLGLAAVHAAGIVHRDIKPENLLVDVAGPEACLKLTDFGIARLSYGGATTKLSGVIGTPEYMAPEVADHVTATAAADLYAAGVVLYELLCGRTPFAGGHPMAVLRRQIDEAPAAIPGVPAELWALIESLLAKDPGSRPESADRAAATLAALEPALAGLPALPPMPERAPEATTQPRAAGGSASPALIASGPAGGSGTVLRRRSRGNVAGQEAALDGTSAPGRRPWRWRRWPVLAISAAATLAVAVTAVLLAARPGPAASVAGPAAVRLSALSVLPGTVRIAPAGSVQLKLVGQLAGGSVAPEQMLSGAAWTSADPAVAAVNSSGSVIAIGPGSTYVTARVGTARATAVVVVTATTAASGAASSPAVGGSPSGSPSGGAGGAPVAVTTSKAAAAAPASSTPAPATSAPAPAPAPPPASTPPVTYLHHVYHTCANGACGLLIHSGPGYSSYPVTRVLHDGDAVEIVCQTRGESVSGKDGSSSNVWDKLIQGDYAADFYIDTPGTTGAFSPPIPQC